METQQPSTYSWNHFQSRRVDSLHRNLCEQNIQSLREFGRLAAIFLIVFFVISTLDGLYRGVWGEPYYVAETRVLVRLTGIGVGWASLCLVKSESSSSCSYLAKLQNLFFTLYIVQEIYAFAVSRMLTVSVLEATLASCCSECLYLAVVWLIAACFVMKSKQLERSLVELELMLPQTKL